MKKLLNVILASFLVLGMIGCANAAGGDAEFKVEQNGSKVEFTLSNAGSVQNLWVSRKNVTKNTDFEQYIYVFKPAEKNVSKITDYFVNANDTYEYIFRCYANGKKVYESKAFTAKADSGIGELVINNIPASTFDKETGILKLDPMPSVPDGVAAKVGDRINFGVDYEDATGEYWFEAYLSKETNCPKYVSDWNQGEELFGKDLTLTRFFIEADVDNVSFNKFYIPNEQGKLFDLTTKINIPDTRPTLQYEIVEANGKKNVKLILPTGVDTKDATRYSIGRVDTNVPEENQDYHTMYFHLNSNNLKDAFITDDKADIGKTYKYTLYYRKDTAEDNGILVLASKPLTVEVK